MENNLNKGLSDETKKYLMWGGAALLVILGLYWLYHYWTDYDESDHSGTGPRGPGGPPSLMKLFRPPSMGHRR